MFSETYIAQAIVSGLLFGGVYGMLGAGFTLTWGVTRTINLMHTTLALASAYTAHWLLRFMGIDPLLSLFVIIPLFFFLGILLHKFAIKQTAKRTKELMGASMVLTFGLGISIENVLLLLFKADPRVITTSYSSKAVMISGVALTVSHLIAFALSLAVVVVLFLFLHQTYVGKAVRAVWQERHGAMLSGIDVNRVTAITYGVALASAGVAGVCMGFMYSIDPMSHLSWLIFVFLVAVVGGVGSIIGSMVAGLMTGVVIGISSIFLPYSWTNFTLSMLLIVILLIRPTGLFQR